VNAMPLDLLAIDRTDDEIEVALGEAGTIVRAYREQDSGCVSYVVEQPGRRLFVKAAMTSHGTASLARAAALHEAVRHRALPRLLNTFDSPQGPAHVYAWVPGEVLYDYVTMDGEQGRCDPASPHTRFRALPVRRILDALDVVYDLHVAIAAAGLVAVDFYDGCILYDFARHRTWVCDLDEYRPGPFTLDEDRLPGSKRFMAPEEFEKGSTIDQRTNIFTLGRTAAVLLGDGDVDSPAWRGGAALRQIVKQAVSPDRTQRYESVSEYVSAWTRARPEALV